MPESPIDNGYESFRETFNFRDKGSVLIPPRVYQRAFNLECSLMVRSTVGNEYYNYRSYPANSFYGYAVLVFHDYVSKLVPIDFGRILLYVDRNDSAYTLWDGFKQYAFLKYDFFREAVVIGELASALGLSVTPNPYPSPDFKGFQPIGLREIHLKLPYGSTCELEIEWEQAKDFKDMDGLTTVPNSKRGDDPKKDKGLPKGGTKPATAPDRNNPYNGTKPPSSRFDLGDFYDDKPDLDNPDPSNNIRQRYRFDVTFYYLRCPYPQDPSNPSTECSRYNDGNPSTESFEGYTFGTGAGVPNPSCSACPTISILIDDAVIVAGNIHEVLSVVPIPIQS